MFHIKNCLKRGDALSLLLFNFVLECAIRRVHIIQDGFKVNGTHHELLVYGYDVNILGGILRTIKKNTEALVVASKEIGLEVNADENKNMVMFRDQNAGRSHNMKIHNSSLKFRCLGTTFTNQNSIREEIKSRLKLGNAYCHSVHFLCSSLLSKNVKFKIYRTIMSPVVYGCETWSFTLRVE
jgi:hypothetical protein